MGQPSSQLLCAVMHMVHAIALGLYMSLAYRTRIIFIGKEKFKELLAGKSFKVAASMPRGLNLASALTAARRSPLTRA